MSNLRIKRGTAAQNNEYVGVLGEITLDTDSASLRVADGFNPGGSLLSKQGHTHVLAEVTGLPAALTAAFIAKPLTANTTLTVNTLYRIVASTSLTLTLPSSPALGDQIGIIDGETITQARTHTIARGGKNIQGLAEDLVLNIKGCSLVLWYNGAEWRLF